MLESTARDEARRTGAGVIGSGVRLVLFLGASFLLHGLLAVAVLWGMWMDMADMLVRPAAPAVAPVTAELIWFEGTGGPPSAGGAAVPAPVLEKTPDPVSRAVAQKRTPPALRARPRPVPAAPPAAPAEAPPPVTPVEQSTVPVEASADASVAEAAAQGSPESAPGSEPALPGSEAGAPGEGVEPRSAVGPGPGTSGDPIPEALHAYGRALYEALVRQRRYPEIAVRLGMEGTAQVQIRILRDGSMLGKPRLRSSSGYEVLDAEAIRMAEAAAPFPPLPDVTTRPSLGFVMPIVFSLHPEP